MVAQIQSFSTEATYELTIDEKNGAAVRCTCKGCQFSKEHNCRHMKAFNVEIDRAATFLLLMRQVKGVEDTARCNREIAFAS